MESAATPKRKANLNANDRLKGRFRKECAAFAGFNSLLT
jgi:hypothetical protein